MSQGCAIYSNTALGATAALVKAGSVELDWYHIFNTTTAECYVQFFDAAATTAVTVGTTTPTFVLGIPAETASGLGNGACCALSKPVKFTTGIVVASTTTATGDSAATTVMALGVSKS